MAAAGAGAFRVVSMAGTLVTLPLVLHYIGQSGFGLLTTITLLGTLLAFSDLGLGNGLITTLAEARGRGDEQSEQRLVSTTVCLLLGVALMIAAIALVIVPSVDWASLLNVTPDLRGQTTPAVAVFALCFVVGVPAAVGQKIQFGLQEGLAANLWSLVGAVLALVCTVACILTEASVPWLVAATSGATTAAYVANTAWVFLRRHPQLRPRLSLVGRREVRLLAVSGGLFFVLAASGAVANQTDTLVLSIILDSGAVATYGVPLRLFTLPILAASFFLLPLWPAYSEALARGDSAWLRRTLRRSMLLSGALTVPSALILLLFGNRIIDAWTGDVGVPTGLLVAFAIWTAVNFLQGPVAMFLNGVGIVRFQVLTAVLMAAINLPLSIALTYRMGVSGPLVATLVSTAACQTVPSLIVVRRILARLDAGLSPVRARSSA